jgi:hypothetical protein
MVVLSQSLEFVKALSLFVLGTQTKDIGLLDDIARTLSSYSELNR